MKIRNISIGKGKPKICLPIVANSIKEAIEQIQLFHDYDLVELRIDYFKNISDFHEVNLLLKQIRALLNCPIILTCRTSLEGGQVQLTDQQYFDLLTFVCKSQYIDIVDIELLKGNKLVYDLVEIAHQNHVYVMMSNHDFNQTISYDEMIERLEKMDILGADILKLAMMPRSYEDVVKMMEVTMDVSHRIKKPVVTMSMGELGKITRICGELIGSSITFGCSGKASAPGQIEVSQLKTLLEAVSHE